MEKLTLQILLDYLKRTPNTSIGQITNTIVADNKIRFEGRLAKLFPGEYDKIRIKNPSYVASILAVMLHNDPDENCVSDFLDKIINDLKLCRFDEFRYATHGWTKKGIIDGMADQKRIFLKYVADYLHVNVYIIDSHADEIYFVGDENLIKYKKHIFVIKDDSGYIPLDIDPSHKHTVVKHMLENLDKVEVMFARRDGCLQIQTDDLELLSRISGIPFKDTASKIDESGKNTVEEQSGFKEDGSNADCSDNQTIGVNNTDNDYATMSFIQLKALARQLGIDVTRKNNAGKTVMKARTKLIEDINKCVN